MPTTTHLDRDETLYFQGDEATLTHAGGAEETGLHDLADLWLDLGGSD